MVMEDSEIPPEQVGMVMEDSEIPPEQVGMVMEDSEIPPEQVGMVMEDSEIPPEQVGMVMEDSEIPPEQVGMVMEDSEIPPEQGSPAGLCHVPRTRHWARPKQHQVPGLESPPSRPRRVPPVATATREALTPDLEAPPLQFPRPTWRRPTRKCRRSRPSGVRSRWPSQAEPSVRRPAARGPRPAARPVGAGAAASPARLHSTPGYPPPPERRS
ncbi:hypothetical protein H8959_011492 [Pygathrix nigripes]